MNVIHVQNTSEINAAKTTRSLKEHPKSFNTDVIKPVLFE